MKADKDEGAQLEKMDRRLLLSSLVMLSEDFPSSAFPPSSFILHPSSFPSDAPFRSLAA
jgi:hypothetical protein